MERRAATREPVNAPGNHAEWDMQKSEWVKEERNKRGREGARYYETTQY